MKPKQLIAFVAVVEQTSIRGAARSLNLSPPAVTKIVRELERELGASLVQRSVKGVELTPAGTAFAPRARLLLENMRLAREEIMQVTGGETGTVSVAVATAFALTLLPRAFKAFHAQRPKVDVVLQEGVLRSMLVGLLDGSLDLAIAHIPPGLLDEARFERIDLFPIRHAIVARRQHPLRRSRSLEALHGAEWVVPGAHKLDREGVVKLFAAIGLPPPGRVISVDSTTIALGLVREMNLLGLFAESLMHFEFKRHGVVRLEVDAALGPSQVCILKRRHDALTPAARHFVASIQHAAATDSLAG